MFLVLFCSRLLSQTTIIQGTVRDSISKEPISFVTIRFDNSAIGDLSDDNGKFRIGNKQNKNTAVFSLMGYQTKKVTVPVGRTTSMDVLLAPEGVNLNEIVVRPKKEKYSKKNNPAVDLIKKVIERKEDYLVTNQDYYNCDEYEKLFFALNEFDASQPQFKKFPYLSQYTTKSKIDDKTILPVSIRETSADIYYRKKPKDTKRIIKGYQNEGLDQNINTESLDAVFAETFKNISITDNNIEILLRDFVGPLNSHMSVDFYKWYIIDTVTIEQKRYINLGFVPFNTRDAGFVGNIYVMADSTYAVKRITMRVPSKINVNFVDEMIVTQEFEQLSPTLWIPKEFTTSIEMSLYQAIKVYVEKVKVFRNFVFNQPVDAVFINPAPEIYLSDYKKQTKDFWQNIRPPSSAEDLRMDLMMKSLMSNKLIELTIEVANIVSSSGYIATSRDEEKNKLDIGTTMNFYSYNLVEGNRFRLTGATTKNFHPHLYLYGFLAYGTKDRKFKYMGETTWAFNERNYHKDEFPKNNLSLSYRYDINALGQRFLQAERDNIFLSSSKKRKLTYDRMGQIEYNREYYNGLSFKVNAASHTTKPAGDMVFEVQKDINTLDTIRDLRYTELGLELRYAPDEKFVQQRRKRRSLPSNNFIYTLNFTSGIKNFLDGHFNYQKLSLLITKQFWVAPFGKIYTSVQGEKIWGQVPFPLLLSASANSSFTVQRGAFDLLEPMEFINDAQFTWHINYHMGGWLFNRIPLIKALKLREVFGFRGFIGSLSKKNDPLHNSNLLVFPSDSYSMDNTPYMEYSVGIENIFQFFRIDYVRRLNYLDHPNIDKDGFRISFEMNF